MLKTSGKVNEKHLQYAIAAEMGPGAFTEASVFGGRIDILSRDLLIEVKRAHVHLCKSGITQLIGYGCYLPHQKKQLIAFATYDAKMTKRERMYVSELCKAQDIEFIYYERLEARCKVQKMGDTVYLKPDLLIGGESFLTGLALCNRMKRLTDRQRALRKSRLQEPFRKIALDVANLSPWLHPSTPKAVNVKITPTKVTIPISKLEDPDMAGNFHFLFEDGKIEKLPLFRMASHFGQQPYYLLPNVS